MGDKLKSFDFFTPVLSTDVIKTVSVTPVDPDEHNLNTKKPIKKQKKAMKAIQPVQESQEDIDAWIEVRKKRFPTRSRVAEKIDVEKKRQEMGALDLSIKPPNLKQIKGNKPDSASTSRPTKIASLLDKMTQDYDREQHSIVLQCFRYFRTHNFLQE